MKLLNDRRLLVSASLMFVLSAAMRWPIYTFPYRSFGSANYWEFDLVLANFSSLMFLFVPLLSLLGVILNWRASCFFLVLSPILFLWFGAVPIPFGKSILDSSGAYGFWLVAAINFIFLITIIVLCFYARSES